jgi:sugar diacid utilization regulator
VGLATRAICDEVARRLQTEAADLSRAMTSAVISEIPIYSAMTAPEQRAAIHAHSVQHVNAIIGAIQSWTLPSAGELAFVKERAALRATQQVPLSEMLHAYRLGHRTVWERLVRILSDFSDVLDASLALTTLTLSYTELISSAVAEGYIDHQRGILMQLDRSRRDLLDSILLGTVNERADTLKLASNFALVPGADFVVVVMNRVAASAVRSGDAESRAAEALRRHLSLGVAQPFVVVRHGEVVSIAPLSRARASSIAHLVRLAHSELTAAGESWAAGVSTVCAGLAEVARGYREAREAIGSATASASVCALLEQSVHDYVVEHADSTAIRMIPPAARRLLASDAAGDRMLVETVQAYTKAEMSVRDAADGLAVHPNTVSYRLEKLGRLLGRDVCRFSDLVEVMTWLRLVESSQNL